MTYDTTLNEMWQIKRELSEEASSWVDYVSNLMDYQLTMERQGVRVVQMPVVRSQVVTAA